MVVHGIDTQANDLDVATIELRLDPSHVAEFGRADRGEVLGVGEQHTPGVPKPLVEANSTFRRLSLEIWRSVANLKSHAGPLGSFGDNAAARLCVREPSLSHHDGSYDGFQRPVWRPELSNRKRPRGRLVDACG